MRFIDNFSTGNRGAASAEYFLEHGYAVIFLSRVHSFQPFTRYFQTHYLSGHDFIDRLSISEEVTSSGEKKKHVTLTPPDGHTEADAVTIMEKYIQARDSHRLLKIPFMTVHEYLFWLKFCCVELSVCKELGLIFAAAAVSDFYIPWESMAQHKLQSSADPNGLTIRLNNVPKLLRKIVDEWAPKGFVISFKLETDEAILDSKVEKSFADYRIHLVVGNLLQSYKDVIRLYKRDGSVEIIARPPSETDIEKQLITHCVSRHSDFIHSRIEEKTKK